MSQANSTPTRQEIICAKLADKFIQELSIAEDGKFSFAQSDVIHAKGEFLGALKLERYHECMNPRNGHQR